MDEDRVQASFAGQFESVLDVRGAEAGLRALRRCWSSGKSPSLAAYAARTHRSGGAIAVVVQAMVRPVCAGVAFSKNPVTGADEVVVEAVRGLGDVLMEGLATPERWSVSREGVAQRLGRPDDVFPAGLPGRVTELCRRLEGSRGTPQDVEWAFDGEHLVVLQARPITALPIPLTDRPPPRQTWTRDEEHVPMALVPFVGSVLCRTFERAIPPVMQSVGLPMEGIQCRLFGARLYMRMISAAAEARARAAVPEACWPEIQLALDRARRARPHRDSSEDAMFAALGPLRYALLEAGRRLVDRGELGRVDDIWYLEQDEVSGLLRGQSCEADIARRRGEFRWAQGNPLERSFGPPSSGMPNMPVPKPAREILDDLFWSFNLDPMMNAALRPQPSANAFLTGIPCSPGQAEGRVVVVDRPEQLHLLQPGDILVCVGTTAAWSFAFSVVGGVITEVGGPPSHPATLAREYCLPAILNVEGATTALHTGDRVRIDGATGQIERLDG